MEGLKVEPSHGSCDHSIPAAPLCLCRLPATMKISRSSNSPGRKYYCCNKGRTDPQSCSYFIWKDPPGVYSQENGETQALKTQTEEESPCKKLDVPGEAMSKNGQSGNAGLILCFTCGLRGHLAKDCDLVEDASQRPSGADEAKSPGECFKCSQPGHWARDCPLSKGVTKEAGLKHEANAAETDQVQGECFKCNQRGHWAKDCPLKKMKTSQLVPGECYKCHQPGHWAKDCPLNGPTENTDGKGTCFYCNKAGHWAKECPFKKKPPVQKVDKVVDKVEAAQHPGVLQDKKCTDNTDCEQKTNVDLVKQEGIIEIKPETSAGQVQANDMPTPRIESQNRQKRRRPTPLLHRGGGGYSSISQDG